MCGIFGLMAFDGKNSEGLIFDVIGGLKRLEYRGYDSSGIGFLEPYSKTGGLTLGIVKSAGKVDSLERLCRDRLSEANPQACIGHTRWATHGEPSKQNAHPIMSSTNFAVVMNGIIENFHSLREELTERGYTFNTDTDTEVVAVLIQYYYDEYGSVEEALRRSFVRFKGSFAYLVISNLGKEIYCCRMGAPMIIGKSLAHFSIASDSNALSSFAEQAYHLEDGVIVKLNTAGKASYISEKNRGKNIAFEVFVQGLYEYDKQHFTHFMLKEIHESTQIIQRVLDVYYNDGDILPNLKKNIFNAKEVVIVGCGTSYNAGLAIQYIMSKHVRVRCSVHIASELRHQPLLFDENTLFVFISQSGETADTLAALEYVKNAGFKTLSFVNVTESAIAKKSDYVVNIMAGPEIGVASTKAFLAQYVCLLLFALRFGKVQGTIGNMQIDDVIAELGLAETAIHGFLNNQNIVEISEKLAESFLILFIGRGIAYPLALEGALKFKEITYKSSEGLPAGELKHGPIALIDSGTYVIAIAPNNDLCAKTLSNVHEVKSRRAKVLMLSTRDCIKQGGGIIDDSIAMPDVSDFVIPALYAVPLQLISYYSARCLDLEIDQPRNLAKSVTVE